MSLDKPKRTVKELIAFLTAISDQDAEVYAYEGEGGAWIVVVKDHPTNPEWGGNQIAELNTRSH